MRWLVGRYAPAQLGVLIDVGCGTGSTLQSLTAAGVDAIGLDYHAVAMAHGTGMPSYARADVLQLPLPDRCADVVLALDVLEHVDDIGALAEICRVLRPGGALIATVPAFKLLWSHRDDDAGHQRRYTARSLRHALSEAGLDVRWLSFYQFMLFPLVLITRMLGRTSHSVRDSEEAPPRPVNSALRLINRMEVAGMRIGFRYPWGSSLAIAAVLPDHEGDR